METVLEYYAQPGEMTDSLAWKMLLDGLPTDLPGLVAALQGCAVHIFWAKQYGLELSKERTQEVSSRPVWRKLACLQELDARPLHQPRPPERRLVCNCRDFSLLAAAALRAHGLPARARCGFGTYFIQGHFEDHWVVETWNAGEERWVMFDAQIDDLMRRALGLTFDTLDMPAGKFVTAGEAWRLCRSEQANPDDFGIFEYTGWDFIRGNLLRDLLALNKIEVLPWDFWGVLEAKSTLEYSPAELERLDRVAEVTFLDNAGFEQVRTMYVDHPDFHIPREWIE